jgi:alanine dehydrogenase
MTLLISNEDAGQMLTMPAVIEALVGSYLGLASGEAVCRPRIDVELPSGDSGQLYRWSTMEGGGPGYFAIRMKSDIVHWQEENGVATREKYCVRPGLFCGLIFLFSTQTGEPLALLNDGVIQHMRVGADSGIGVKYMARENSEIVGMLGSGGMARSHIEAFLAARPGIRRLQVYSPTRANREKFASEVAERYAIEAVAVEAPEAIYEGADIVAAVTDAARPVLDGDRLEAGCHVVNIGAGGSPDPRTIERCDVYLRFGDAPAPRGRPEYGLDDEYLSFTADAPFGRFWRTGQRGQGKRLTACWHLKSLSALLRFSMTLAVAEKHRIRLPIPSAAICRVRSSGRLPRLSMRRQKSWTWAGSADGMVRAGYPQLRFPGNAAGV